MIKKVLIKDKEIQTKKYADRLGITVEDLLNDSDSKLLKNPVKDISHDTDEV